LSGPIRPKPTQDRKLVAERNGQSASGRDATKNRPLQPQQSTNIKFALRTAFRWTSVYGSFCILIGFEQCEYEVIYRALDQLTRHDAFGAEILFLRGCDPYLDELRTMLRPRDGCLVNLQAIMAGLFGNLSVSNQC
jgi:hypothetical protein